MAENPFEVIEDPKQEADQIEQIAELMRQLLAKRYTEKNKPSLRGVHPKSHGCFQAKFEVLCDLAPEFQVGLFSEPGASFDSVVRFSNADTLVREDFRKGLSGNPENGSRGMAIKILNMTGEVIYEDTGGCSQDFLMVNTEEFAFANIPDYLKLQQILLKDDDEPTGFFKDLNPPPSDPQELAKLATVIQSAGVIKKIKQSNVANPLEVRYFGAAPFLFGDHRVMRVSAVPHYAPEQVFPADPSTNFLREAVEKTMSQDKDVVFDFKIQVRDAGEEDLHIEDATRGWPEDQFPYTTVGQITIPAPQPNQEDCEDHFFTPWHSLAAHQPLGGINRLRRAVYIASAKRRNAIADA